MRRLLAFICAVVGAFLVLTLVSCDGELPVAPDANTGLTSSGLEAQAYPAMHSVTGMAMSFYEPRQQYFLITFNARVMPDGAAQGNFHWQFRSRRPGGRIFVKVSCLNISGNEARIVGQASQAGNPDNVGKWMGLRVLDHGEGAGAEQPDEISQRWFGVMDEAAMAFCSGPSELDPPLREVTSGNIQVR